MKIGVLALQGAFVEHVQMLLRLGVQVTDVRLPADLDGLDGLIVPGGESTTIGKLAVRWGLLEPLRALAAGGVPVWGTCAGMILLANQVQQPAAQEQPPLLGLMDLAVQRNAFGRQVDSFEVDLAVPALPEPGRPFHAVFIRAPLIREVGPGVEVLARLDDGTVVAARQGRLLVTSFHPELTGDDRFHRYFLSLVAN